MPSANRVASLSAAAWRVGGLGASPAVRLSSQSAVCTGPRHLALRVGEASRSSMWSRARGACPPRHLRVPPARLHTAYTLHVILGASLENARFECRRWRGLEVDHARGADACTGKRDRRSKVEARTDVDAGEDDDRRSHVIQTRSTLWGPRRLPPPIRKPKTEMMIGGVWRDLSVSRSSVREKEFPPRSSSDYWFGVYLFSWLAPRWTASRINGTDHLTIYPSGRACHVRQPRSLQGCGWTGC